MTGRRDSFARLPPALRQRLTLYCATHDEAPADVVIDALTLHLDVLEGEIIPEEAVSRVVGQA